MLKDQIRWVMTMVLVLPTMIYAPAQDLSSRQNLKERLANSRSRRDSLESLFRLTENYLRDSVDHAITLGQYALELAIRLQTPSAQAQAYDMIGRGYSMKGSQLLAMECFEKGMELAQIAGDDMKTAYLLNSIGVLHSRNGQAEKAMAVYTQAQPIWEKLGARLRATYTLANIGSLQTKLGHLTQAIRALEKAYRQSEAIDYGPLRGSVLDHLGVAHEKKGDYEKALFYHRKVLELMDQFDLPNNVEISTLGNIHNIYIKLGNIQEAEEYYDRAITLARKSNDPVGIQQLLKKRADALLELGKLSQARIYYQESLEIAQTAGFLAAQADIHLALAKLAEQQGEYQQAYKHQKEQIAIQQQISDKESQARMDELQARFQLNELEKQVSTLQADQQTKEMQLLVLLALVALAVVGLLALYSRYHIRRRTQRLIMTRNDEIERQNQLMILKNREIHEKNQRLEDQRYAIQAQNQQLTQSNEELGQLAYAASHDLREPLRTISSYLQLLNRRHGEQLDESGKEFLFYALNGAKRMQGLLSDLLAYARLGRVKPHPEDVDLTEVMQQVEDHLQSRIVEANAKITWQDLPGIQGYKTELYLLFQNLVGNAIKFRREGVTPTIHIATRYESGYYLISVADNGIGIDAQNQDRVFQIFQRLHLREEFEGSGVGLTLCQKIVRNHGGRIWFESTVGEGTTFWIKLPKRLPQSMLLPSSEL